jgi:hypothetical protein
LRAQTGDRWRGALAMSGEEARPAAAGNEGTAGIGDFLIARGGPFYELQQRLGLLHAQTLHAGRRATLLVGLAWGVPLLLSALAGHAIGPVSSRPFLLDLGAWARFFVAIAIFMLMERLVEERLRAHLAHFGRAPLLASGAQPAAAAALVRALRRRDAWLAELVCLILAYAPALAGVPHALDAEASSWLVLVGPEGAGLTAAGWWCALASNPLFWFLLLRWLWRHAVWGLLLRDLAGLDLRLVATHPDGAGGLAFIGQYPNAFAAFVFALSCVVGAALAHTMLRGELTAATYGQVMGAWLVVVILLFGAPLLAFTRPLKRLKEATVLTASAAATRRERALERELLGRNMAAASDADATAAGDLPDPAKLYATATKLSTFLISRAAIVPVAAAALLPLVAAGATQLPFRELLKIARGLLLL